MLSLSSIDNDSLPVLNNKDWIIYENLVKLLEPLESATRNLCGDSYATASMVIPVIRTCINQLSEYVLNCQEVLKFRACLIKNMNTRFNDIENNKLFCCATLLDPRFKQIAFKNEERSFNAVSILKSFWDLKKSSYNNPNVHSKIDVEKTSISEQKFDLLEAMRLDLRKRSNCQHDEGQNLDEEIDNYLSQQTTELDTDIFKWWTQKKDIYQKLYFLSQHFIYLPATSASSERVFSNAGYILNQKRSKLKGDHVNMLLFLNNNIINE